MLRQRCASVTAPLRVVQHPRYSRKRSTECEYRPRGFKYTLYTGSDIDVLAGTHINALSSYTCTSGHAKRLAHARRGGRD